MSYFDGPVPRQSTGKSGPESSGEWLFEIVRSLELTWASDSQEEALVSVVDQILAGMGTPTAALRVGQALIVRPELPEARTRPSITAIRDQIVRKSPVTAQSPDGVRWCQVAALAAAAQATLKSQGTWAVVSSALGERDHPWVRKVLNPAVDRARERAAGGEGWTDVRFPADVKPHALDYDVDHILSAVPFPRFSITANFQQKVYDLDEIRQKTLTPLAARLCDVDLTLLDLVNHLGAWIARVEGQLNSSIETNALWWGQSLYSYRRGVSYREVPPNELLVLMADELLDAVDGKVSDALVAYFVETVRRLVHDLDAERPWADQVARLVVTPQGSDPLAGNLRTLVSDDPTGLPFTYVVAGGPPAKMGDMAMTRERTIGGRAWARQVFRERQLNRWFAKVG